MLDRFIDGQEKCALRRHLDRVGPDTPIADIVDRCCVWESHEEIDSGRGVNPKLNRPHSVFQVTDNNNNEQNETSTGLDVVANLIKRLRDGTTAGARKFRHYRHRAITKKVNTSRASHRKGSMADTGKSGDRRSSVGKRCLIRGGGLVTRISDDKEPQFHINRKYHHQPRIEKDTVNRVETMWPNGYGPEWNRKNDSDPTPNYPDSDESDSDEMLPLGSFWPTPEEEEWTIVGKPHGVQRYDKDIDCNRLHYTRDKLDRSGMCCKQLDYIDWNATQYDSDKFLSEGLVAEVGILNTDDGYTWSEVLPTRQNEAAQNDSPPSSCRKGPQLHRLTSEPVLTSMRPSFTTIRTLRRRPIRNCPWTLLK